MKNMQSCLMVSACALSMFGCAEGTNAIDTGSGGGSLSSSSSAGGTEDPDALPWVSEPWDGAECANATQFIYVVTTKKDLYRFWPPTLSFEYVGRLKCPTVSETWTPLSMSIDRMGQAWILYWDQVVYRLDLSDGTCVDSGYNAEHKIPGPFGYFGMAFTADAASPAGESLFVRQVITYDIGDDPGSRTLGRFDTAAATVTPIGNGFGGNADLAGTGDGRLFGFEKLPNGSGNAASQLGEYDPQTGTRLSVTALDGLEIGDAWALAGWGGDLWLFTSLYSGATRVVQYRPATGTMDIVVPNAGFEVIGAGVSSCAPITPPK